MATDLNIALATGPVCVTLFSTWLAGTFVPMAEALIIVMALVSGIAAVICGIRSWRQRKSKTPTIDRILARSIDPQS